MTFKSNSYIIELYKSNIGCYPCKIEYSSTRLVTRTIRYGHTSLAAGGFTWDTVNLAGLGVFGDNVGISEVTLELFTSLVGTISAN